ncbi:membrane fusion protein, adhesin transport system [Magnetospirillum fulvum]|uniref:Membrane fusion protein (MFP) family protein n=1 Tax=Magnetospirillum fulvum TaxID=1082 RepID=A0A1H6H776_MAGFU|nr:membrane fusion protein, adhesin transport system [Magnetospirillum fulvum]
MPGLNSDSSAPEPGSGPGRKRPFWSGFTSRLEAPETYLWLITLLVGVVILWAALASVDRVVRVEGRIIPAGRGQSIQHLEGGIVAAILVQEGAVVRKGEVLIAIDDTTAQTSLAETRGKLDGLRIRAVRLEAEAQGLPTMKGGDILHNNRDLAESEARLFTARRQKLAQETLIFEEQIRQRTAELREIEARQVKLRGELETARERNKLIVGMASRNAASQLEVLDARSREQRLQTELSDAEGSRPKILAAIAESQARSHEAAARYRAEAQSDLSATLVEIERMGNIITGQADRFIRTEVRAPVDGIVNRILSNTVGGVVKPGDTIIEITPSAAEVLVEARARPSDRGDLRVGLPAKVRVSAFDIGELGPLSGHVVEVSADTVPDGKGDPYYRVAILVDHIPQSYFGKKIVPGMTVTADVITGQRTILQYITSPFTRFLFNAFRDAR